MIIREACVGSFNMALTAEQNHANRIEVCERLDIGGITPSEEMLLLTREKIKLPLMAMVRPRGGDFTYTRSELDRMLRTIKICKSIGYDGIAVGALTHRGTIDKAYMRAIMETAAGMDVTFHMAFDECHDRFESMEILKELGVNRILTKGGQTAAVNNIEQLRALNTAGRNEIIIMPGGGVTKDNYLKLAEMTGVHEVHGTKIV